MKKKLFRSILFCIGFLLFTTQSYADVGFSVKGGTLGAGAELTFGLTKSINTRLGGNYFTYDMTETESDVEYDFELDLQTVSLLIDWHPGGGGFRITAGAMYNGNSLSATGIPASGTTYEINDVTYTDAQVGALKGEIDFESFAPYVGIGYGNAVKEGSNWSFALDIGVLYQGTPSVSLTADGTLASNSTFQSNLEAERQQLEDELEDYELYPVLMFGISYKF